MATLGQDEKIVYISKNLVSGLTNVKARVSKPNGDIVGPFTLTEFSDPEFKGFYYFNFSTNASTDDNGTYVGVISSPSENNHRTAFKINYDTIAIEGVEDVLNEVTEVLKLINNVDVEVEVEPLDEIEVSVEGE